MTRLRLTARYSLSAIFVATAFAAHPAVAQVEAEAAAPAGPPEAVKVASASLPYAPLATSPQPTGGLGANLGVGFAFVPTPPDMTLTTPDGAVMKPFSDFPVKHVGGIDMVALSISALYRTASPLTIPLLGFEIGIPVTTGYPATIPLGAGAGALTWARGGPTYYDGLDVLGLGVTLPARGSRIAFEVLPGFRYLHTTGTITQGLLTVDAEAHEYSFSLRADASLCLGTKGVAAACLFGAPHLFEFGHFLNGAVFGARLETN